MLHSPPSFFFGRGSQFQPRSDILVLGQCAQKARSRVKPRAANGWNCPIADTGLTSQNARMADTDLLFRLADAAEEGGNFDLARASFERGADLGSVECLTRLAYIYDQGLGVAPDKPRAMKLYRRAWRRSHSCVAANNIAILYREAGDRRLTFRWFQRAAQAGDGSAQLDLAKCYIDGEGVRANPSLALRCLVSAVGSTFISEDERDEARELIAALAPRLV